MTVLLFFLVPYIFTFIKLVIKENFIGRGSKGFVSVLGFWDIDGTRIGQSWGLAQWKSGGISRTRRQKNISRATEVAKNK